MIKVDCLIPSYRHFNASSYHALVAMMNYSREEADLDVRVPALFSGGVIHWARNRAVNEVRKKADFILFCDDDMLPERDALARLVAHNVPVVSALTTTRQFPVKLNVKAYDDDRDTFYEIEAVKPNTLISGHFGVGAGFLLIKHHVLDAVLGHYFSARDWAMDYAHMFDRMGVSQEAREAERKHVANLRQARQKEDGRNLIFDFHLDHENQIENGEDVSFSRRIIQLGIPIAVDTGVEVGHVGERPFGPWDVEEQKSLARTIIPAPDLIPA